MQELIKLLSSIRFPLQDEKQCQAAIERELIKHGILYRREWRMSASDIPDFFAQNTVIEVKIKGNAKAIYKQLERYCVYDACKAIILITNRSMGLPETINGKPCYLINMGKAWL